VDDMLGDSRRGERQRQIHLNNETSVKDSRLFLDDPTDSKRNDPS
jgi:hypothetical protein